MNCGIGLKICSGSDGASNHVVFGENRGVFSTPVSGPLLSSFLRLEGGSWRGTFLLGLLLGAGVFAWFNPAAFGTAHWASAATLVVAGVLVGVGTQLANGCTSGHGVCGVARGSPRSLVSTLVFMVTAVATVALVHL